MNSFRMSGVNLIPSSSTSHQALACNTATQPVKAPKKMSEYHKYVVNTLVLDIPEFCFKMSEDLSLRDNDNTRRNDPATAKEAADIVSTVGVIVSSMMNTAGGVLHIQHVTSDNKVIDKWLNTLQQKLSYIPKADFDECISIEIVDGQDVFMYVKKSPWLIVCTHMYCRSPVASSSEAELSRAKTIVRRKEYPHHSTKIPRNVVEYDYVMPSEGMHIEYKNYRYTDVDALTKKIAGCSKDIFSLANCKGGGCFVIGVDDETLKVKGVRFDDKQKNFFMNWLTNWLKESDSEEKRIWGDISREPKEDDDWELEFIPVSNHPNGGDFYIIVLTLKQCHRGVFTCHPEFYTVDISGEIYRQQHSYLIDLMTLTKEKPQMTKVHFSRAALGQNHNKWDNVSVYDVSPNTNIITLPLMSNPLNISTQHNLANDCSGDILSNLCNQVREKFASEKGWALVRPKLGACMSCSVTNTIPSDHVYDVVVCLDKNSRVCVISQFTNSHSDSNIKARRQYVFQLARILKHGILSKLQNTNKFYDVKIETQLFSVDTWSEVIELGKLQDFYNEYIETEFDETTPLAKQVDSCISSNTLRIKTRLGEEKTYCLTEEQFDVFRSLIHNTKKVALVEAAPGCGKSLIGARLCREFGGKGKVLYVVSDKAFLALREYQEIADVLLLLKGADMQQVKKHLEEGKYELLLFDDIQTMECSTRVWTEILETASKLDKKPMVVFLGDPKYQDHYGHKTMENVKEAMFRCRQINNSDRQYNLSLSKNLRNSKEIYDFVAAQYEHNDELRQGAPQCGSNLEGGKVMFKVIENILDDTKHNKVLKLLRDHQCKETDEETDVMLLLCDGDDKDAQILRDIISRHGEYTTCCANIIPPTGIVVDLVDSAVGIDAEVCILVWLRDTKSFEKFNWRVFAASRGVMRVTFVFPRDLVPWEEKLLGLSPDM